MNILHPQHNGISDIKLLKHKFFVSKWDCYFGGYAMGKMIDGWMLSPRMGCEWERAIAVVFLVQRTASASCDEYCHRVAWILSLSILSTFVDLGK